MRPYQVLLLWASVDMGVMAMKGPFPLCITSELEPHHQIQFILKPRKLFLGGLSRYRGYSVDNKLRWHGNQINLVGYYPRISLFTYDNGINLLWIANSYCTRKISKIIFTAERWTLSDISHSAVFSFSPQNTIKQINRFFFHFLSPPTLLCSLDEKVIRQSVIRMFTSSRCVGHYLVKSSFTFV